MNEKQDAMQVAEEMARLHCRQHSKLYGHVEGIDLATGFDRCVVSVWEGGRLIRQTLLREPTAEEVAVARAVNIGRRSIAPAVQPLRGAR